MKINPLMQNYAQNTNASKKVQVNHDTIPSFKGTGNVSKTIKPAVNDVVADVFETMTQLPARVKTRSSEGVESKVHSDNPSFIRGYFCCTSPTD